MQRIMQWANFKSKGVLRSYPMVLDGGGLTADVPEDMELISITAASGVWMDEGAIVDAVENPAVKEGRKAQARALAAQGLNTKEIAQKIGATMPMVTRWLTEATAT